MNWGWGFAKLTHGHGSKVDVLTDDGSNQLITSTGISYEYTALFSERITSAVHGGP